MAGLKKTGREQELIEKARKYLPGGTLGNASGDVVIAKGQGSHIWDSSGNEYVDYLLGSGPMILGHAHPDVAEAVRGQLESGSTFFANNEHAIELAEEICKAMPCADKVRFCSTGTEATLYAMRAARAFRKRDKILKFEGGFHGMNDYSLMSIWPTNLKPFPEAVPGSAGIPKAVQETMLVAPFNDLETTTAIIEKHHDELGGVIVEPFQRLIAPKPGFLQGLREITTRYEIPLIFDEVVTSFRFAYGGAQEFYGVVPDICSLGKAAAGGYPLTAVAGRDEIMAHFDAEAVQSDDFMPMIGTLSGNPIAAVAGLATLKILKQPGTYDRMFGLGWQIRSGLQRILDEAEIPAKVVGEDVLFDVYFTDEDIVDYRSTLKADSKMLNKFNSLIREKGVFKGPSKFYLSAVHSGEDVEKTMAAFKYAAEKLSG
ncbi:MAG: aspartate aminotransferase family protein [Chloroflexi bacterium]|nr:aspartate aminotransferase family protein [Chloroflexota bacterium]